jgi:hypothetical protein
MEISEENNGMIRNIIVLGCTALLTIGLSFGAFAGAAPDADADGVPDAYDNCVNMQNGPAASIFGNCNGQQDTATNGYGNPCDTDINHDGVTGADDLADFLTTLGDIGTTSDFNCDGVVGADDLAHFLTQLGNTVGPSGLACAAPTALNCSAS